MSDRCLAAPYFRPWASNACQLHCFASFAFTQPALSPKVFKNHSLIKCRSHTIFPASSNSDTPAHLQAPAKSRPPVSLPFSDQQFSAQRPPCLVGVRYAASVLTLTAQSATRRSARIIHSTSSPAPQRFNQFQSGVIDTDIQA